MRKILLLTLSLCLFAGAAQAADLKIGVFSMSEVVKQSAAFEETNKKLESTYGPEVKKLEEKEKKLKSSFDDFQNKMSGYTAEKRENEQMELVRQKRDFEDQVNTYRRKRGAEEEKQFTMVTRAVLIAVTEYGKKNNYSMIFNVDTGSVIHVSPEFDLTKQLVEETNKIWKQKPKALTDGSPILTGVTGK